MRNYFKRVVAVAIRTVSQASKYVYVFKITHIPGLKNQKARAIFFSGINTSLRQRDDRKQRRRHFRQRPHAGEGARFEASTTSGADVVENQQPQVAVDQLHLFGGWGSRAVRSEDIWDPVVGGLQGARAEFDWRICRSHVFRQPTFDHWAFNMARGQHLLDKWNQIPIGIDVLVTHTPPLGRFLSACQLGGQFLSNNDSRPRRYARQRSPHRLRRIAQFSVQTNSSQVSCFRTHSRRFVFIRFKRTIPVPLSCRKIENRS